jgi:Immunity protein 51
MALKTPIFEAQGRLGGGYDWASVARVILVERLPDLVDVIKFDSEAGMFAAYAPPAAIVRLGAEMLRAYKDDGILRDFLSRAELD